MFIIKQTKLIRRQDEGQDIRLPNLRYVYLLTAFVSLGAFLFGYGMFSAWCLDRIMLDLLVANGNP